MRRRKLKLPKTQGTIPPAQFRKHFLSLEERVFLCLWVIGGFSQKTAYRFAYGRWEGSPHSLAPAASRLANSPHLQEYVNLWVEYFYENPIQINEKGYKV